MLKLGFTNLGSNIGKRNNETGEIMVPEYDKNGNVTGYTSLATNVRTPNKPTRPYFKIPNKF